MNWIIFWLCLTSQVFSSYVLDNARLFTRERDKLSNLEQEIKTFNTQHPNTPLYVITATATTYDNLDIYIENIRKTLNSDSSIIIFYDIDNNLFKMSPFTIFDDASNRDWNPSPIKLLLNDVCEHWVKLMYREIATDDTPSDICLKMVNSFIATHEQMITTPKHSTPIHIFGMSALYLLLVGILFLLFEKLHKRNISKDKKYFFPLKSILPIFNAKNGCLISSIKY